MKNKNANMERLRLNMERAKQMHERGMNMTEIAFRLGLTESTVRSYIATINKEKSTYGMN